MDIRNQQAAQETAVEGLMVKRNIFLMIVMLCIWSCSSGSNEQTQYSLRCSDCKGLAETAGQSCYMLSVKENRNDAKSRFIDVFVVVLKALNENPTGKPTLFLHGGPGNIGTQLIDKFNTEKFRRNHDLVFFDQRGLGRSNPSILCKNLNSLLKANQLVIQECLDEFAAAGADIRGYDTRQSAIDLKELRESLGISQWNVYGVSYGTRYALDLMRVDPEGTACLVLDSPMTTSDPNNTTDINLNMQRVFNLMFEDCAAQGSCNAAYPDLEQKFYTVTDYIKQHPIVLQVKNPVTGVMTPLTRSSDDYTERIGNIIGLENYGRLGPSRINKMHKHVTGKAVMTPQELDLYFANRAPSTFNDSVYFGIALSIYCREMYPILDFTALDTARAALSPFGIHHQDEALWREGCPMACSGEIKNEFWEPVTGDKPVLILTGTYDTLTPKAWADKVAGTLSNVTYVTIPATGHAMFDLTCPKALMAAFLDHPTANLDISCISAMPQVPDFYIE
jgi:pimeloyl-ACP methyl ester carboxylesterase